MNFPDKLLRALEAAKSVFVVTGAGVSAESGVPTFRDAQTGLWAKFKPEELATPEAFRQNPALVWDWYAGRRAKLKEVKPNPGHEAIARIEQRVSTFRLATQNVDGLHQRAGSRSVIELHGNITRTKCFAENVLVNSVEETGETPPRCPRCNGYLRPDVVWFGETLPEGAFEAASDAAETCDVCFSIGTSSVVQPAASLPFLAGRHGAVVVEINPEKTLLTEEADYFLQGPSGQILPPLVDSVWG